MAYKKKKIFVDTSAFATLVNNNDQRCIAIQNIFATQLKQGAIFYTTDYVLDELLTLLKCRMNFPHDLIITFFENIFKSKLQIVFVNKQIFMQSFSLFKKYKDRNFSFTDCVSFIIMKINKIKDVLSLDKHFTIMKFNVL